MRTYVWESKARYASKSVDAAQAGIRVAYIGADGHTQHKMSDIAGGMDWLVQLMTVGSDNAKLPLWKALYTSLANGETHGTINL